MKELMIAICMLFISDFAYASKSFEKPPSSSAKVESWTAFRNSNVSEFFVMFKPKTQETISLMAPINDQDFAMEAALAGASELVKTLGVRQIEKYADAICSSKSRKSVPELDLPKAKTLLGYLDKFFQSEKIQSLGKNKIFQPAMYMAYSKGASLRRLTSLSFYCYSEKGRRVSEQVEYSYLQVSSVGAKFIGSKLIGAANRKVSSAKTEEEKRKISFEAHILLASMFRTVEKKLEALQQSVGPRKVQAIDQNYSFFHGRFMGQIKGMIQSMKAQAVSNLQRAIEFAKNDEEKNDSKALQTFKKSDLDQWLSGVGDVKLQVK